MNSQNSKYADQCQFIWSALLIELLITARLTLYFPPFSLICRNDPWRHRGIWMGLLYCFHVCCDLFCLLHNSIYRRQKLSTKDLKKWTYKHRFNYYTFLNTCTRVVFSILCWHCFMCQCYNWLKWACVSYTFPCFIFF